MTRVGGTALAIATLMSMSSCSVFSTGTMQPYEDLRPQVERDAPAKSCLDSAYDQAERAHSNRATDIGLIAVAALFSAGGLGLSTSSNFISDTHNGGQPSDTRQLTAGMGAVSVGVGAALLGLRTALNLGELSTAQIAAATTQASLAEQITHESSQETRRDLFGKCMALSSKPSSAYPGAVPSATVKKE